MINNFKIEFNRLVYINQLTHSLSKVLYIFIYLNKIHYTSNVKFYLIYYKYYLQFIQINLFKLNVLSKVTLLIKHYHYINITYEFNKLHINSRIIQSEPFIYTIQNCFPYKVINNNSFKKFIYLNNTNKIFHWSRLLSNKYIFIAQTPLQTQLLQQISKLYLYKFINYSTSNLYNFCILSDQILITKPYYLTDITEGIKYLNLIFENRFANLVLPNINIIGVVNNNSKLYNNKSISIFEIIIGQTININNQFNNHIICKSELFTLDFMFTVSIMYNLQNILINYFYNSKVFYITTKACYLSLTYSKFIMSSSLYNIYKLYNINLPNNYIDLIVYRMNSCVQLTDSGSSMLTIGNIINFSIIEIINLIYKKYKLIQIQYFPVVVDLKRSILINMGFLTKISFQKTLKILLKSSIENETDWISNIKSGLITNIYNTIGNDWIYNYN